ncbi:MAG: hypothetical protein ABJ387_09885 [Balneola sp.]|jgi:hypothetical protein
MKKILLLLFLGFYSSVALSQQAPCSSEEHRQFDFWVGEWEVKNPNDQVVGSSKIELVSNNCALLENWTNARGLGGKSLNYYSILDQKWHQKWIGANGIPIEFSGTYNKERKALEYSGEGVGQGGIPLLNKLTFFHLSDDHVRQLWEQSTDDGKTWNTVFDGHYRRKK